MRTILLALAFTLSTVAIPFVVATSDCGGVTNSGATADTCRGEYHYNNCTSYCYQADGSAYGAFAQYSSAGGLVYVGASEGHDGYCYSDSYSYYCGSDDGVGVGTYVSTFAPFVGPVSQGAGVGSYGYQSHGTYGDQCQWFAYAGPATVPVSSDCGTTFPALP